MKSLCRWIEKTYLNYDLNGFKGDRKFVHDVDAQKCFSKLRTAIAGLYSWRLSGQCPPECRPRTNDEAQALLREARKFVQHGSCYFGPAGLQRQAGERNHRVPAPFAEPGVTGHNRPSLAAI